MTNSLSLISKVQSQLLWAGALLCGLSLGVAASAEPPSAAQATDSPAAHQAAPAVPFDLDIPPPVVSGSNDRSESLAGGWSGAGDLFEGFTEPYRSVEVAAPESGTIEEIVVRQGQLVKQGDILAVLDRDILQSSLDIARAKSESTAKREAAKIESLLKQRRLDNFYRLGKDNSSNEEIERARADVDLAQTQVLAAEEELKLNSLELQSIHHHLHRCPHHGHVFFHHLLARGHVAFLAAHAAVSHSVHHRHAFLHGFHVLGHQSVTFLRRFGGQHLVVHLRHGPGLVVHPGHVGSRLGGSGFGRRRGSCRGRVMAGVLVMLGCPGQGARDGDGKRERKKVS